SSANSISFGGRLWVLSAADLGLEKNDRITF
ncbi:MAG: hypothetical protein ACI8XQ_000770, partial [Bermanella sp.]